MSCSQLWARIASDPIRLMISRRHVCAHHIYNARGEGQVESVKTFIQANLAQGDRFHTGWEGHTHGLLHYILIQHKNIAWKHEQHFSNVWLDRLVQFIYTQATVDLQ